MYLILGNAARQFLNFLPLMLLPTCYKSSCFSDSSFLFVCAQLFNHVQLFAIPWTGVHWAPPPMGASRQEYWSVLPPLTPGDNPWPRNWIHVFCVSCISGGFFLCWAIGDSTIYKIFWARRFYIFRIQIIWKLKENINSLFCDISFSCRNPWKCDLCQKQFATLVFKTLSGVYLFQIKDSRVSHPVLK